MRMIREMVSRILAGYFPSVFDKLFRSNIGVLLALGSGVFMSGYAIAFQSIATEIHQSTVLTLRGSLQFGLFFGLAWHSEAKIRPQIDPHSSRKKMWLALAVVLLCGGLRPYFVFLVLQFLPSGTVLTLLNGAPILIMLVSPCFFPDDPLTLKKVLCSAILALGIALNFQLHPWSDAKSGMNMAGFWAGTLAMTFSAVGSLFSKISGEAFDPKVITAYNGVAMLSVSALAILVEHWLGPWIRHGSSPSRPAPYFPTSPQVWLATLGVAVMGSMQHYLNIAALQWEQPTLVSMVRASNIPVSFLLDWLVMNIVADWDRGLGAALVCAAIVISKIQWSRVEPNQVQLDLDRKPLLSDDLDGDSVEKCQPAKPSNGQVH